MTGGDDTESLKRLLDDGWEAARLCSGALDLVAQIRQTPLLDRTIAVASNPERS